MEVAARENMVSHKNMSDLENILSEILLTSKIDESRQLAHRIQRTLVSNMKRSYAGVYDLGVKQAPFYVLLGAQMPAILIEVAFISNEQDAENLQNPNFLAMLTKEIVYGIKAYVNDTTAQLSFIE